MDKIIKSIIGILIGVFVLYLISAILAIVVIVLVIGIKKYINYRDSKIEWTKWEFDRDTVPIISKSVTGEKLFQSQSHWVRYNRFTNAWETKLVIDPVKRPFSEATKIADLSELRYR